LRCQNLSSYAEAQGVFAELERIVDSLGGIASDVQEAGQNRIQKQKRAQPATVKDRWWNLVVHHSEYFLYRLRVRPVKADA
jgi:hypothetical protein